MTERAKVKSSNIASVGYDDASGELTVEFRNGAVHRYSDVPENLHRGLMEAESLGKFFHANIRNAFESEPVEEPAAND